MIKREQYLQKLRGFYDSDLVKVITGVRRSGKSVLLSQVMQELRDAGVPDSHIIFINFEDLGYSDITDAKALDSHIKAQIADRAKYYVFLDEVQNVAEFERAVNSLRATQNVSLFITGSNGKLLSGELATLLSGRYVSTRIMPFSYREVFDYTGTDWRDRKAGFLDYMEWGGMPQLYNLQSESQYGTYLEDLYNSIILRDIIERYGFKNVDLLNRVLQFVIENIGGVFSVNSIVKYLKNEKITSSPTTIYRYLDAIEASLIISRANRYDIRGKKVIQFYEKYYVTDLGLLKLKRTSYEKSTGGRLENIVYNELLVRGKKVYVGEADGREVDFIAEDQSGITYIQVAETLSAPGVEEREFSAFAAVPDSYPRLVLSMDELDYSQGGVRHVHVVDWLLQEL
jgi:predicted AAA+ superfamily ATPase